MIESSQQNLFDLPTGEARKEDGIERATHPDKRPLLEIARDIAVELDNRKFDGVTADDVRKEMIERGFPTSLGPAWGALFRKGDWHTVGWRKSTYVTNNARMQRIWTRR